MRISSKRLYQGRLMAYVHKLKEKKNFRSESKFKLSKIKAKARCNDKMNNSWIENLCFFCQIIFRKLVVGELGFHNIENNLPSHAFQELFSFFFSFFLKIFSSQKCEMNRKRTRDQREVIIGLDVCELVQQFTTPFRYISFFSFSLNFTNYKF
eukprot:Pompholyxophrys_punicea_v1_NODE_20_length_5743_cov_10.121371.p2 type:complete len:153 gc:universal NODE_20_length_5743_cov_10.121371:1455-1913(+)